MKSLQSLLVFTILSTSIIYTQDISNTSNIWYLGDRAGVDFNTSPPSALTNGLLNTQEGVASVSDSNGKLLFYTDGRLVWDNTHRVLNPSRTLSGHSSSSQSAVIVPNPSNPNLFFIFTVDELAGRDGIKYTEIDITLPGNGTLVNPLGDIVPGRFNIDLISPASEKINAVLKSDNSGFWVITHGWNNDEFYVFSVDCAGVNHTPNVYKIGNVHGGSSINSVGYLKSSFDRNKIALVNRSIGAIELFDFDSSSGAISNPKIIEIPGESLYGLEFTFDNRYLYIGGFSIIYRYELATELLDQIPLVNGNLNSSNAVRALQLGPDKNIYVTIRHLHYLSAIVNPSSTNASLSINHLDIDPLDEGRNCRFGLPNIINFYSRGFDTLEVDVCSNESYNFFGEYYPPNTVTSIVLPASSLCDSTFILKTNEIPSYEISIEQEVCPGESYDFMGTSIQGGEIVEFALRTVDNCDSTIILYVEEADISLLSDSIQVSLCPDDVYHYAGINYLPNTINSIVLNSSEGCDSTVILKIEELPSYENHLNPEICINEVFEFLGTYISIGETVEFYLKTKDNCDSVIIVSVTEMDVLQGVDTTFVSVCQNEVFTLNGIDYLPNTTNTIELTSFEGCDSTSILIVDAFPDFQTKQEELVCPGETFEYMGRELRGGESTEFELVSAYNCDSTVIVSVTEIDLQNTDTTFVSICQSEVYTLNGIDYFPNTTNTVEITSQDGCESTFILKVEDLPNYEVIVEEEVCPDDSFEYQGVILTAGQMAEFEFKTVDNCDSIVTLIVSEIEVFRSMDTLTVSICPDETYTLNGEDYSPNSLNEIVVSTLDGCDSTYVLIVQELPSYEVQIEERVCPNDSFEYMGIEIRGGESATFELLTIDNCDSIVIVIVSEIDIVQSMDTMVVSVCPDETYLLNGENFRPNTFNPIVASTMDGCDSISILWVSELPTFEVMREEEVCAGGTYEYLGLEIPGGESMEFILNTVDNCDSIVHINVIEANAIVTDVDITLCPNESFIIMSQSFSSSLDTTVVFFTETCDSTVHYRIVEATFPDIDMTVAPSCRGESTGTIEIKIEGDNEFQYSIDQITYNSVPVFDNLPPGSYTFFVRDLLNCEYEFEVELPEMESALVEEVLYLPNIFQPNSINNNCFQVFKAPEYDLMNFDFRIFDRWGGLVFESSDIDECWDGRLNGRQLEQGVYVYLINVELNTCNSTPIRLFGDLTLFR